MGYSGPGTHTSKECWSIRKASSRLEAYLLSAAMPEFITDASRITPDVVVWYEALFYNVWPYLKNDTYIVTTVMDENAHHGVTERDCNVLWKILGYAFGPVFLREFLKPVRGSRLTNVDGMDMAVEQWAIQQLGRKFGLATQTIPVFNNQAAILEAWAGIRNAIKEEKGGVGNTMISNVQAALIGLPFVAGKQGLTSLPQLQHYDGHQAELRAQEQLEIAVGSETSGAQEARALEVSGVWTNGCTAELAQASPIRYNDIIVPDRRSLKDCHEENDQGS